MITPATAVLTGSCVTLIYRPVRRLYSIPAGDADLLRQVVRNASAHWGGVSISSRSRTWGTWHAFDGECAAAETGRLVE